MEGDFSDFTEFSGEFTVIMPSHSTVPSFRDLFMIPQKRKNREDTNGYPLLRFESTPPKEFLCLFCQNVVKKPLECKKCNKLYCFECVTTLQKNHNSPEAHGSRMFFCSACNSMQEPKQPSLILIRIISELKIKCANYDVGCKSLITIEEMNRHDLVCPFREVTCENYRNCRKSGLIKNFIESENPLRSIYSHISNRSSHSTNKCYLCSEKCRKIVEFEKLVSDKQFHKALLEYYNLLKKIEVEESKENSI